MLGFEAMSNVVTVLVALLGGVGIAYYAHTHPGATWFTFAIGVLCIVGAIWPAWGVRLWRRFHR